METNGEVSSSRKSLRSVQRSEGLPTERYSKGWTEMGRVRTTVTLPNFAIISPASFFAQMPVAYSYSNEGKVTSLTIGLCQSFV
jgi:hypothetical protein